MRMIALAALCLLAGCNTMTGLGEDMENAGANLSNTAQNHQHPAPQPPEVMSYPDQSPDYQGP